MLFFKQAVLQGEIGHDFLQGSGLTTKILDLAGRRGAGRVARQTTLAGFEEFLGPAAHAATSRFIRPMFFHFEAIAIFM
jgi:hypothetical protein